MIDSMRCVSYLQLLPGGLDFFLCIGVFVRWLFGRRQRRRRSCCCGGYFVCCGFHSFLKLLLLLFQNNLFNGLRDHLQVLLIVGVLFSGNHSVRTCHGGLWRLWRQGSHCGSCQGTTKGCARKFHETAEHGGDDKTIGLVEVERLVGRSRTTLVCSLCE